MDTSFTYEIRVEGQLENRWADWFDGLTIRFVGSDETILSGTLTDQSALFGVLTKIHNLNLVLISVYRTPAGSNSQATPTDTQEQFA